MKEKKVLNKDEQLTLECDCGCHYLTITYWSPFESKPPIAFLTCNREHFDLWSRIKSAFKILLDKEDYWTEFVLDSFNKAKKLRIMAERIENSFKKWEEYRSRKIKEMEEVK